MEPASVFYFDRVSHAAIALASHFHSIGALIVFEPCRMGRGPLFDRACELADVVKYSEERIRNAGEVFSESGALLEVQTLGSDGLRYRFRPNEASRATWTILKGFKAAQVRDSTGAGDWCTAALIASIGRHGRQGLAEATEEELTGALWRGQALAAINCQFEGARGLMYATPARTLMRLLDSVLTERDVPQIRDGCPTSNPDHGFSMQCPKCPDGPD